VAGTLAYLIDPALVHNKAYLISTILILFWGLTFINMRGLHVSAVINNICCVIGTMLPMFMLIALGAIWFFSGRPLQISFSASELIPPLDQSGSWVSLIAIMASFLGMELSGVHVKEIANPQKNFPRAVLLASLFIFVTMLLGSLSIAITLPKEEINLISGVMQLCSNFFSAFGLEAMTPIVTLLIFVGTTGTMINWLISPAKGLLHAAEFGFLPPTFSKLNRYGVAYNILLAQGVVVSAFCLLFLLESNINSFYWFLTALSTELYMVMYVLMFSTALCLHYRKRERQGAFKIPGKGFGIWSTSLLGLLGCITTIVVSFFPPDNIDIGSPQRYIIMISVGNILTISPLGLFYLYEKRRRQLTDSPAAP
jgi:amino acid transporter